jgi:Tol biopolymer transport system component
MANSVNLTNDPADDDRAPIWSPDSTAIAFARNNDILVVKADGSNLIGLTGSPEAYDYQPSFSPDGAKIAFVRPQPDSSPRALLLRVISS